MADSAFPNIPNETFNPAWKNETPTNYWGIFFKLIPLLLVGWIGWKVVDFFYGDQIYPNDIRGAYVTSTYIPTGANQGKNFLLTDDSFHYFYSTSSPGQQSSGSASMFNKIYYGFYQPGKAELENRKIETFSLETPTLESYWINGKIWLVGSGSDEMANILQKINPDSGQIELNVEDLVSLVPEFKVGILTTSVPTNPNEDLNISIKLLDGSTWYYFPSLEKAFKTYQEYLKWLADHQTEAMIKTSQAVYLTNDIPPKLGRMTGAELLIKSAKEFESSSPSADYLLAEQLKTKTGQDFSTESLKTDQPFGEASFIEGEILYQDGDYALILHQKTAQELAPRWLSLVNIVEGTVVTFNEDQLLPGMRVDPNDDFSSIFFIRDNLSADRAGELIFFKYRYVGEVAINVKTGKIAWSIDGDNL